MIFLPHYNPTIYKELVLISNHWRSAVLKPIDRERNLPGVWMEDKGSKSRVIKSKNIKESKTGCMVYTCPNFYTFMIAIKGDDKLYTIAEIKKNFPEFKAWTDIIGSPRFFLGEFYLESYFKDEEVRDFLEDIL